jgi:hypothetical protein
MIGRRIFFCICVATLPSLLTGCGGGETRVGGTVKFTDGTPLTKGEVLFSNEKYSASGPIKEDGTFLMGSMKPGDGVPPGTYKVTLGGDAAGSRYANTPALVDAKYFDPTKSGLVCEVEAGKAKDFPITVEAPAK